MKIPMLDVCRQQASIAAALNAVIQGVISEGRYLTEEPVTEFETKLARYCGRAHAIGVGSGTSALHLAYLAAGIGPGDEVITVPNSFFATTETILNVGAVPRFVDVDPATHLMTSAAVREAVTSKTRAVVPVHLFGSVVDVPSIAATLHDMGRSDIVIVEDCAHAAGARRNGHSVPLGPIGAFSFNPGKNIGALGDAGAIVTDDDNIGRNSRLLRDHGRQGKNEHVIVGFNTRLDRLSDRVLALKMDYLEQWNESRRRHAARYDAAFFGSGHVVAVMVEPEVVSARHQYVVYCSRRDGLRQYLSAQGVATGVHYPKLIVEHEPLRHLGYCKSHVPEAARLNSGIVSLPCFPELTSAEVDYVIAAVLEFARLQGEAA